MGEVDRTKSPQYGYGHAYAVLQNMRLRAANRGTVNAPIYMTEGEPASIHKQHAIDAGWLRKKKRVGLPESKLPPMWELEITEEGEKRLSEGHPGMCWRPPTQEDG